MAAGAAARSVGGADTAAGVTGAAAEVEQELASQLRQRHLRLLRALHGEPATWHLHGGVVVDATLVAADSQQDAFLVSGLESGVGVVPAALLRGSDVRSAVFAGAAAARALGDAGAGAPEAGSVGGGSAAAPLAPSAAASGGLAVANAGGVELGAAGARGDSGTVAT